MEKLKSRKRKTSQFVHPIFQAPQQPQTRPTNIQDLRGYPWLDPCAEPLQSSVDAFFGHLLKEDFILSSTLSEATKNKTLLAKDLPKQTDIDSLIKVLNRKILTKTRFPESMKDFEAEYVD